MLAHQREKEMRAISKRDEFLRLARLELNRQQSVTFRCEWVADDAGLTSIHTENQHHARMQEELKMAARELVMVRRAALQKLLREEELQYKKELNCLGKTFYKQRL